MTYELDTSTPALVLKIGGDRVHHGTLGIIRSLGRLRVPVFMVTDHRLSPAARSRYLTGAFVWKSGQLAPRFLEFLSGIAARLRRQAILIPTNDVTAAFVAENSSTLEKWFLFPRIAPSLPRQLANKMHLYALCEKLGVPCPQCAFPLSRLDQPRLIESSSFPIVVKAADSELLPDGVRSTSIAHSSVELEAICRRAQYSTNLVFQQYIPEECSEDWIFHAYRNATNGSLLTFTGRKLRSHPPDAGITARGMAIWNEALNRQAIGLLTAIGYSGIADLDYRLDHRDGEYKLLDFNPRIGANFRMFQNLAGIDVVRAMHLDLTGKPIPQFSQAEGRVFIVEPYDLAGRVRDLNLGKTVANNWPSLKGARQRELAWFDWRDPRPFISMGAQLMVRVLGRRIESLERLPFGKIVQAQQPSGALAAVPVADSSQTLGANESSLNTIPPAVAHENIQS